MPEVISARDNPGTLREFETVIILRPDTLQDGVLELNNKIKTLIDEDEGRVLLVENWGKRRLAYEIQKQLKGIYMYYQFLGHSQLIKELERNFRLSEAVIRYFTTRVDENVDPDARPAAITDEEFLAASATRPDEEELATGYVVTGSGEKIPVSRVGYDKKDDSKPASATATSDTAAEKTDTAEAKDEAPKAEAKGEAPKTEAKDEAPKAEAKDEAPKAEAKDEAPKAEAKDEAPKAEAKDEAPAPDTSDDKEEA
jgi:small subunit ribosomal protein S6